MAKRPTGTAPRGRPDDRPTAPRLSREMPRVHLADLSDGEVSDVELVGVLPDGWDEPLQLSGVRLTGASLVGARLAGSRLVDVELVGCDLSGADLEGAAFTRVSARDARWSGVQLAWARWQDVRLVECRLDQVNLARLTAQRLWCERCTCVGADLRIAQLEGATFRDCDLSEVDVAQVTMQRVRLHGSRLDGLRSAMSLHPVEVDAEQHRAIADSVLEQLGVSITPFPDPDDETDRTSP